MTKIQVDSNGKAIMLGGKALVAPEGGATINNQNKTITENGTYTADSGYTGLGEVTVNVSQEASTNGYKVIYDPNIEMYDQHGDLVEWATEAYITIAEGTQLVEGVQEWFEKPYLCLVGISVATSSKWLDDPEEDYRKELTCLGLDPNYVSWYSGAGALSGAMNLNPERLELDEENVLGYPSFYDIIIPSLVGYEFSNIMG